MSMAEMGDAFETLTNPDVWTSGLAMLGGLVGSVAMKRIVENRLNQNIPDELYGGATIVLGQFTEGMIGDKKWNVQAGGVGYTVLAFLQRVTEGDLPDYVPEV